MKTSPFYFYSGRKRRPDSFELDDCAAAMVLMSLSASPRSPTSLPERSKYFRCTWRGCSHEAVDMPRIVRHVRETHLNNEQGEEDFYFEEVEHNGFGRTGLPEPASSIGASFNKQTPFLGSDSPYSLSEDAASTTSSGSIVMTNGENSMDSGPPSPISNNSGHFFKAVSGSTPMSTSIASNTSPPQVYYAHLEDHEYVNRRPEPAIMRPRKKNHSGSFHAKNNGNGGLFGSYPSSSAFSSSSSKPINIPSMSGRDFTMSHSFNGSDSFASSGFGSFSSSAFSSMSPRSAGVGGSLSSSLSSSSHHKHARIGYKASSGGLSILQSSAANSINRTSPTKRVRGETRKCRKVYGMEKKDQWCTQCKWKKACTRFTD